MAVVNNGYKYVPEWEKAQAAGTNQYAQQVQQMQSQQAPAQSVTTTKAKTTKKTAVPIGTAASYAYGADPGNYSNRFGAAMDDILSQIRNRKKFKYEFNSDALFNAYKDLYTENGKQASLDAMGQAAALTGGYGNSYAQQAGQQTYQQYLRNLYDVGLDLRDRAYQMNQDELADLYNQYGLLQAQEAAEYARYQDAMGNYLAGLETTGGGRGGRTGDGDVGKVLPLNGKYYKFVDGKMVEVSEEDAKKAAAENKLDYTLQDAQDMYNGAIGTVAGAAGKVFNNTVMPVINWWAGKKKD